MDREEMRRQGMRPKMLGDSESADQEWEKYEKIKIWCEGYEW